jgi:hypothetical protein
VIIAVDADGTLFDSPNWPEIAMVNVPLIEKLIKLQEYGHKIILWTCREGDVLHEALDKMREWGLLFDAINEDILDRSGRKVTADVYIDDRSLAPEEFVQMPERMLRRLYGGNTGE